MKGGIVLGAKAPAHSLAPRRRGPCKALIHSGGLKAAFLFSVPPPYDSELSTGPKPKTAGRYATGCVSMLCGE